MSMSETIRQFAAKHPVFGSDEIRALHGDKAALLVSALAKKGQFERIRNGVFGPVGADDTHPAYEDYLERIHNALVERSKLPGAGKADRLFAWAADHGEFSMAEANRHFGEDMKSTIAPYVKRGTIQHPGEGRYLYEGPRPAARRTAVPMAEPTAEESETILNAIGDRAVTAAQIALDTAIDAPRLRAVLTWMADKGALLFSDPASTNAHRVYRRPGASIEVKADELAMLAIIAAAGTMSTRAASTHKMADTPGLVQTLLAAGHIERSGDDIKLGGASYAATPRGIEALEAAGYQVAEGITIAHRPVESEILRHIDENPGIGYIALHRLMTGDVSENQVEITALRLVRAGLVESTSRRPASLRLTRLGKGVVPKKVAAKRNDTRPRAKATKRNA